MLLGRTRGNRGGSDEVRGMRSAASKCVARAPLKKKGLASGARQVSERGGAAQASWFGQTRARERVGVKSTRSGRSDQLEMESNGLKDLEFWILD